MGLESKGGLPRYLQAREYRKAAEETLNFVRVVTGRFIICLQTVYAPGVTQRLGAMKPKFETLVENMYNFKASEAQVSHNVRRARQLLRNMNFIYPVRLHHLSR